MQEGLVQIYAFEHAAVPSDRTQIDFEVHAADYAKRKACSASIRDPSSQRAKLDRARGETYVAASYDDRQFSHVYAR